jgi:hypothetical protein
VLRNQAILAWSKTTKLILLDSLLQENMLRNLRPAVGMMSRLGNAYCTGGSSGQTGIPGQGTGKGGGGGGSIREAGGSFGKMEAVHEVLHLQYFFSFCIVGSAK